jgi:hypothetical protein
VDGNPLEVMAEHTGESKPRRTLVIERTRARVIARFGPGAASQPSRATAFRLLEELERAASVVPVEHEAQSGYRGPPEACLRQAAAHATR